MKFFGNYLVEKGIIDTKDLVCALSAQSDEILPLAKIAVDNNLLSIDDAIACLERQAFMGEPYIVSLASLGLLTKDLLEERKKEQKKSRRPLGHILSEVAADCDVDQIVEAVNLFVAKKDHKDAENELPLTHRERFTFQSITGDAQKKYVMIFEDQKKKRLEKKFNELIVDFLSASVEQNKNDLTHILDELTVIMETAVYANAHISKSLSETMVSYIELFIKDLEALSENAFHDSISHLLRGLDVLWEIRTFIDKSGSEKEFWDNPISRENFANAFNGLKREA